MNLPGGFGVGGVGGKGVVVGTANEKKEKFFAQVPFIKKKYEPERKCLFGFKAGEKKFQPEVLRKQYLYSVKF